MPPTPPSQTQPRRGPARDALAALALALLGVAMLKAFFVEAFTIPSPSMQPTLLGCAEADVYDRVLVDKLQCLWREPQRWDLTAFHFPLQQRENFVKRLVGLPGERLRIAAGNLYRVHTEAGQSRLEVVRKPDAVQRTMWRELYPARRVVRGEASALSGSFVAEPPTACAEHDDTLAVQLPADQPFRLTYADRDGGLVDRLWDGYPLAVARALRDTYQDRGLLGEIVPDARLTVQLAAAPTDLRVRLAFTVRRPQLPLREFACELAAGRGSLLVRGANDEVLARSGPFDCAVGDATELAFAHLDDELIVWRNDLELARLDCSAEPCLEGCQLPDPCGLGPALPTATQRVDAMLELRGLGRVELRGLRLDRDQHYTRGDLAADEIVEVPAGHYFLLGDNPLQSSDGRSWRTCELSVDDAGQVVPTGSAGAQVVRGNFDPSFAPAPLRRDENPIALPEQGVLLLRDLLGNVRRLHCDRQLVMANDGPVLRASGDTDTAAWPVPIARAPFVPRELIGGRVCFAYWPWPPFGPARFGWRH